MKMYLVGGAVRDELLGVHSKDQDFTVVLEPHDFGMGARLDPFTVMKFNLVQMGFEIFLETPEFLTIRARFPKGDVSTLPAGLVIHSLNGLTADFVLARKESDYTDGRRPNHVEPGTLIDDLARRDFTMNAVAKDDSGTLIDPFGGVDDIERRLVRAVGDPYERFEEDSLRIVRAMRFSITKNFFIDQETRLAMHDLKERVVNISAERVREELVKMFNASLSETVMLLDEFNMWFILEDLGINFMPTLAQRVK